MALTIQPPYYGTVLQTGSRGPDVAQIQTWLNGVHSKWPQIITLTVDGQYGSNVTKAVSQFQTLSGLTSDGKVGQNTWNALYTTYASIHGEGEIYCGIVGAPGARGAVVKSMQQKLAACSRIYTGIQTISADGIFGSGTSAALRRFQPQFGLTADALLGKKTFPVLAQVYQSVLSGTPTDVVTKYPGYNLKQGSSGDYVRFVQSYLNKAGGSVPKVTVDGQFGSNTQKSVVAFQKQQGLQADGIVGSTTFNALRQVFNNNLG